MDIAKFNDIVAKAIDELPDEFRDALENIEITVEDLPTRRQVSHFEEREGMSKGRGRMCLLGLYQGVPLHERGANYSGALPDKVTLFKESIEEFCNGDEEEIARQIQKTLLHEIGHYFGIGDRKLRKLGY